MTGKKNLKPGNETVGLLASLRRVERLKPKIIELFLRLRFCVENVFAGMQSLGKSTQF